MLRVGSEWNELTKDYLTRKKCKLTFNSLLNQIIESLAISQRIWLGKEVGHQFIMATNLQISIPTFSRGGAAFFLAIINLIYARLTLHEPDEISTDRTPLMQQLITTMASQVTPPCNIEAGEPLIAILPGDSVGVPLSLVGPDGTRHTVRPVARGAGGLVQFGQTRQPGIYTLTGPDAQGLHFVAQTRREESDPRLLDPEQMKKLAVDLGAELVDSGARYVELDKTRRHGREIWRFLLLGVMGLMFAELILQQRFTRVRR